MAYGTSQTSDAIAHLRGLCAERAQQVKAQLNQLVAYQEQAAESQHHLERELRTLDNVLDAIDGTASADVPAGSFVGPKSDPFMGMGQQAFSGPLPVGINYQYQHPGTAQIHGYEG